MEKTFSRINLGGNLEQILKDSSLDPELLKLIEQLSLLLQEDKRKISALERKVKELTKRVYRDSLTNLPIYFSLHESHPNLEQELLNSLNSQRKDDNYSIFFLDVNNFKRINEILGYQLADKVLVYLAESLRENKRDGDYVFRRGNSSDEFIGIFKCSSDKLLNYFDRVQKSWDKKVCKDNSLKYHQNDFSFSVGVAPVSKYFLRDKEDKHSLISTIESVASELMKKAKKGKDKGSYIVGLSPIDLNHVSSFIRPDFYIHNIFL